MTFARDELQSLAILRGLSNEEVDWFCEHGECIELAAGEHMFERGEPADAMWIVVDGVIQGIEEHGGQWLLVAKTEKGQVTGMLPFSRMTHYPRYTIAARPSRVLKLSTSRFQEMIAVSYEVGRRLVASMSDRVRGDVRLEQQSARMLALGRLSAGLAHELNNPATAVRRACATLIERHKRSRPMMMELSSQQMSASGLDKLQLLRNVSRERHVDETSLQRSRREDELSVLLEGYNVPDPWDLAAVFTEAGITATDIEELSRHVPGEAIQNAMEWLGGELVFDDLLREIDEGSARISELVAAIKVYSYMDRSPEHKPTDIAAGLESTLTMFGHKLKEKTIHLTRDYGELPAIPANGGELNQVWTNLIDNAIEAVGEGGELVLRTRRNDRWIEVAVIDNGPGIPEEMQSRIFEPFFTTKEVGLGTGLGLGIAMRIVETHQGHIDVLSVPGQTEMVVRLPIAPSIGG